MLDERFKFKITSDPNEEDTELDNIIYIAQREGNCYKVTFEYNDSTCRLPSVYDFDEVEKYLTFNRWVKE